MGNTDNENRFSLLFPRNSELTPPFTSQWPELSVEGLNTKGHIKFEKAVATLLNEGQWNEWDAAMAYINYVPACIHPAEAALCYSYASMWLLKWLKERLGSSMTPPLSEVFATKNMIMNCLQASMALCIRFLHPGMQFYLCRLCLGTAMQTMQLTESLAITYEARLITTFLHLTMYSSRFCPVWHFPSIPLSEAVLLNLKSARYHLRFLLGLQYVQDDKRPVSLSEMLYQIHENDLRGVCRLEDSAGARARAMEEMLCDKGWTWNDVVNLMISPLSPRDSEGWLIQQKFLGASMPFAKLTGFIFNTNPDSPSIEIVAIPADPSNGLVGLFSMDDIQTVLQLASSDAYPIYFSLDPPNLYQKRHPFQEWRYEPKELQNSLFLHTLFEADYLLKFFSVGAEVSAKPPFESRPCKEGLTKNLPYDLVEAIKPIAERGGTSSQHVHRFWIQADIVEYNVTERGPRLEFDLLEPTMHIRSHPIVPGPDGKYHDAEFEDDLDSPEATFAFDLTCHYNELGKYFPVFARLRELAKLQTLVPILGIFMRHLKDKADGKGLQVPNLLLTEIQQDAHQHHQDGVEDLLKRLDKDVNIWPAAGDQTRITSQVKIIMDRLPAHAKRQASFSDIEPLAKSILQKKDEKVLNDITDIFLEICEQRLSKEDIKKTVNQWLLLRNSSSATELRDLICSVLPLPSKEDVIRNVIQPHHHRIHLAFQQNLDSITSPPSQVTENFCKWVPAAAVKDENGTLMYYGGVVLPARLRPHNPISDSSSKQSQVPTFVETLKRLLCVPFQAERTPAHNTANAAAPFSPSFSANKGPFTPRPESRSESTDEDNQDEDNQVSESSTSEGNVDSTTRSEQEMDTPTRATDSLNPDSKSEIHDSLPNISNTEASSHATVYTDEQCKRPGSSLDTCTSPHVDSGNKPKSPCDCESHMEVPHGTERMSAHVNPKIESKSDRKSDVNHSIPNAATDDDEQAAKYDCSSDSDSEINGSQTSIHPCEHKDADSNRQKNSLSEANSTTQPVSNTVQYDYNATHDTTSGFVDELNPVMCEGTALQWRHPGYGIKALCTGGSTTEKAAIPDKMAHPCALYTKVRYNCTKQKYKEYLSIEKEGRQRVKRLLENFNISRNITIHASAASTADAHGKEKVNARRSALLAAIDKHQEWIAFATKTHSGTAKANDAVKDNRLAKANNPCRVTGCQCCNVMAQSNICSDDDGYQSYRAELTKEVNCRSSNVVYLIRCRRSGKNVFIGQTKEELHECLNNHRTRKGSTVYEHFTSKGFSFDDMEVVILADIDDDSMRKEKEVEWMKKLTKSGHHRRHKEGTK